MLKTAKVQEGEMSPKKGIDSTKKANPTLESSFDAGIPPPENKIHPPIKIKPTKSKNIEKI